MTAGGPPAAFETIDVRKAYRDVVALDGVSLTVATGECLAIVGESGSGKTTLLHLFNRLVEPDAGSVLAGGEDVAAHDPIALRRRIGYVPQTGGLLPHWTVLRNVALVPSLERHADPEGAARSALELVGLAPEMFAQRRPAELSGGQRQRVAIARALAAQPRYLLLDEAFSALDAITRGDVHEAFLNIRRKLPVTTLLVTHDLREAVVLADRTAVLRRGRLEHVGPTREVVAAPATPYVAELIRKSGVTVS
ncbi:MAG TPA: ATP-binding cassette domain-containing protein [Longimicrobiales bacterium]|nr:ATP-binding cassette domain-containing protein [Longimicrobiales bacterium]